MKTKKTDPRQLTIYDILKNAEAAASQATCLRPGSCDIDAELRAALFGDLKYARNSAGRDLSRYEVAGLMSELVGHEITCAMLNNWTADSHREHKLPALYIPALCQATGGRRTIEVLTRHSGLFALPGPEALRAEIRRMDEQIKRTQAEKRKREILLGEVDR